METNEKIRQRDLAVAAMLENPIDAALEHYYFAVKNGFTVHAVERKDSKGENNGGDYKDIWMISKSSVERGHTGMEGEMTEQSDSVIDAISFLVRSDYDISLSHRDYDDELDVF